MSYVTEVMQMSQAVMFTASGDSETNARLVTGCGRSLRLDKRSDAKIPTNQQVLEAA